MGTLVEQAIAAIERLPKDRQEEIAAVILEELADEERWNEAFEESQDQLARLASKVREDVAAGRYTTAGMDEL